MTQKKKKKTAHADKDTHAKEVQNSKTRKIDKQHQIAVLDDWIMTKHLPNTTTDPILITLHQKFIKQGVKTFNKTIKQVPSYICTSCH